MSRKQEIEKLIEKYDSLAQTNFDKYQESGESRYLSAHEKNDDLAHFLRLARDAEENHRLMIDYKCHITEWGARAQQAKEPEEMAKLLKDIAALAVLYGFIRRED